MADLYLINSNALTMTPTNELQKKRIQTETRLAAEKQAALEKKSAESAARDTELVARYDAYEAAYAKEDADLKKFIAEARANGGFFKPADPKVVLVVRIKGVNKLCPRVRKVFQLFRLTQIHNATFVKINKASVEMLKYIEPFCTYGYPSLETIRKLIYKRGSVRVGPKGALARVRITDNDVIDAKLGALGVRGVEDMVHQIYTCGEHFKEVNNFLWTFKLRSPSGGFVCKRHGFAEFRKGDWGNREQYINDLVNRMM